MVITLDPCCPIWEPHGTIIYWTLEINLVQMDTCYKGKTHTGFEDWVWMQDYKILLVFLPFITWNNYVWYIELHTMDY